MDKDKNQREFSRLSLEDRDLTMFTITNLTLNKKASGNIVYMALKLKRKVTTELLTTYVPTILLLLITFTITFFYKDLWDADKGKSEEDNKKTELIISK